MHLSRRKFLAGSGASLASLALLKPADLLAGEDKLPLTAAGYPYRHVKAFMTGDAAVDGCHTQFEVDKIGDLNTHAFSGPQTRWVTEIGLGPYLLAYANDGFRDYTLLPVFPLRTFRHKSIFVHDDSGIEDFTAEREPSMNTFSLRGVVHEVFDSLAPQLKAQDVQIELDVPPEMHVSADQDMLRRAVLNLTLNALDAMPDGGEIVATGVADAHGVELEIADSGPGMSSETMDHAFEPFYTTKGSGTGLGLAIVDRIVKAHGGNVRLDACPEGGLAVTLRVPQVQAMEAAA